MPGRLDVGAQPISLGDGLGDCLNSGLCACHVQRVSAGFCLFQAVLAGAGHGCSASVKETLPATWNYPGQPVGKLGWIAGE
jgi:hypothetical protein